MTIKELRLRRKQAEVEVLNVLRTLEMETGLVVEHVRLVYGSTIGDPFVSGVRIDVELEPER